MDPYHRGSLSRRALVAEALRLAPQLKLKPPRGDPEWAQGARVTAPIRIRFPS